MNLMTHEAEQAIEKAKGTKGRKDGGQEAVIKIAVVTDRIADLVTLYEKAEEAKRKLQDAIKATAEKSGLLATTVSKFVAARASDDFEERNTKVQQMALVFDEVGPVKGSRGGTLA